MFDKYLIVEDSLRATTDGFSFAARLGYYRGLGLSMIETLEVSIDGVSVPREEIGFDEGNGKLGLNEMAQALDRRWPFGATATIFVAHSGGLSAGVHRIDLREVLRISYLPYPLVAEDSKQLTLVTASHPGSS